MCIDAKPAVAMDVVCMKCSERFIVESIFKTAAKMDFCPKCKDAIYIEWETKKGFGVASVVWTSKQILNGNETSKNKARA